MKKFLTLIFAAGMVLSAAGGASAVELKVSGQWMTSFTFADNMYTNSVDENAVGRSDGSFMASQRLRLNLDMVASEYLSGRIQLQVGNSTDGGSQYVWGNSGVDGPGKEVTARQAYLDWMIPTTDILVRMGRQEVALPSYTFGSSILSDTIDGVMVAAPINDMVTVNVGWMRAFSKRTQWGENYEPHSNVDLAYLSADVAGDGFKVTPWGMLGFVGSKAGEYKNGTWGSNWDASDMLGFGAANENTMAYWAGIGGELTLFDPFKFTADFVYSANDADHRAEREGWYAALGAEMKTAWATPFLRGWYASGDDADSEKSGRMLSIGHDNGAFDASSIYYDAFGFIAATPDYCSAAGTWGVQLGVKEVSFLEDLSHQLSVTYFQGTNNTNRITNASALGWTDAPTDPMGYMTTSDSAWSIDFLNSYKLYENLTANLLLAYLVTDFDEKVWGPGKDYGNIFRGTLNFTYNF